jgi:hypothetical protein
LRSQRRLFAFGVSMLHGASIDDTRAASGALEAARVFSAISIFLGVLSA